MNRETRAPECNEWEALVHATTAVLLRAWPKRAIVYNAAQSDSLACYVRELLQERDTLAKEVAAFRKAEARLLDPPSWTL